MVIVLGVLAATATLKFINLTGNALIAKAEANAGVLRSAVKLANMKWRTLGSPSGFSLRNDIQLYGSSSDGQVDIHIQGYPAQSYLGSDVIISADNDDDCLSIW